MAPASSSAQGVGSRAGSTRRLTIVLGATQTLAYASSYYLPAILAVPIARDLGVSPTMVMAAFSIALAVSALVGPFAGRAIDRGRGRVVLAASSLLFAAGLALLAASQGTASLMLAWVVIGVAMGAGLYESAFAAVVRIDAATSRRVITGITLMAGLASTIGWPLSTVMEAAWGWRGACAAWAAAHLVLGLPLYRSLPRVVSGASRADDAVGERDANASVASGAEAPPAPPASPVLSVAQRRLASFLLAFVFAAAWFVSTALAAHLPQLLALQGATPVAALAAAAMVGPAQVAGRVIEFVWLSRWHPLLSARLAALLHPLGAAVLVLVASPAAWVPLFALLHGAGNGILTIAKGTLPLAIFGPDGYGQRLGWLMAPSRVAQAFAPLLFGVALERWGAHALLASAAVMTASFVALMALPRGGHVAR